MVKASLTKWTMRASIAATVFGTLAISVIQPTGVNVSVATDNPIIVAFIAIAGSIASHYFPGGSNE